MDLVGFIHSCEKDIELDVIESEFYDGDSSLLDQEDVLESILFLHGLDKAIEEVLVGHILVPEDTDGIDVRLREMYPKQVGSKLNYLDMWSLLLFLIIGSVAIFGSQFHSPLISNVLKPVYCIYSFI